MSQSGVNPTSPRVAYRAPAPGDASRVHALVDECKPLDLNSTYAYMLLCTHFAATCAIAEQDGDLVGFVSGYVKPADSAVLFIWQVAVSPRARGRGIGKGLLQEVLKRPACRQVRYLETTITPSNGPSWALFRSLAQDRAAPSHRSTLFRAEDFGGDDHEEEQLLRIGPF